ncbi:MAG: ferritin-like domain-containing protein [Pseudomonadota bacterium]|nr:ferritin-like domain-containing protein [Pseudomonadota bacterium]
MYGTALDQTQGVGGITAPEPVGWRLEDIDFAAIDPVLANENEALLLLLVASSFIESGTRLYASNLVVHFEGDHEVSAWLAEHWEPEELQHGRALRAYVACVWPSFDWDRAYVDFIQAYRPLCTMGKLEARRGLEMAARCVVETGTTTLYRAIHHRVREPVLRTLLRHISEDELQHYKHFFRYFRNYQQQERSSRAAVFGALIRRTAEISREDTDIGLRYACAERCRGTTHAPLPFDELQRAVRALLRSSVPIGLAGAMWLRPLQLGPYAERQARRIFSLAARTVMACSA